LDDVVHRVATSRRQLQRSFAEIAGTTFRCHLTAVRMSHAAALLATRSSPIRVVARQVGYPYSAQFAKAFQHYHGVTPSVFRADARKARHAHPRAAQRADPPPGSRAP
jgi:AraC-like DNA-binding protein